MPGIHALGASLELLTEIGPERVSARILERAEAVREVARGAGWRIVGSSRPEDLSGDRRARGRRASTWPPSCASARERGVILAHRRGRVRISPHVYNNDDDLGRLAETLQAR